MIAKHTPSTLEAARQVMRCHVELHYLRHGLGTLAVHLNDSDLMDQATRIFREAMDKAGADYDRAMRDYRTALGKRPYQSKLHMHVYNLGEIAEQYAWKH